MRSFSLLIFFSACASVVYCQVLTANDFVALASLPEKKMSSYLAKSGFRKADQQLQFDTIQQTFYLNSRKLRQVDDSAVRYVQELFYEGKSAFNYCTSSYQECRDIIKSLKDKGFYCENENVQSPFLYQQNDVSVKLTSKMEDTLLCYNFLVKKEKLPSPASIHYAEDFLAYQSHENLEYVFGKSNVQKDVYYFSDSDVVKCSILFPNTNRQVIFVWKDELNRITISHLLVGNSLRGNRSRKYDTPVAENVWTLRNGLRANMSLSELLNINEAGINFYGWNSQYPGIVVPVKNGTIDFKSTGVVLSCLNCGDSDFLNRDIISSDEAIESSKRMFVLAVIIMPQHDNASAIHR
ncbi:MAG: hypothetical protein JWM28_863 [Chitinophagaceae bacterium]|nr:hypothetical protein [Chitinophagaceae bacterium]